MSCGEHLEVRIQSVRGWIVPPPTKGGCRPKMASRRLRGRSCTGQTLVGPYPNSSPVGAVLIIHLAGASRKTYLTLCLLDRLRKPTVTLLKNLPCSVRLPRAEKGKAVGAAKVLGDPDWRYYYRKFLTRNCFRKGAMLKCRVHQTAVSEATGEKRFLFVAPNLRSPYFFAESKRGAFLDKSPMRFPNFVIPKDGDAQKVSPLGGDAVPAGCRARAQEREGSNTDGKRTS